MKTCAHCDGAPAEPGKHGLCRACWAYEKRKGVRPPLPVILRRWRRQDATDELRDLVTSVQADPRAR